MNLFTAKIRTVKTRSPKAVFGACILLFTAVFTANLTAQSAGTFNANLSSAEQQELSHGEVLIRNIGNAKKISLNPINNTARAVIDTVKALKPPYLVEIIQVVPYKGNENLLDTLRAELTNVESYVDIPYFGARTGRWYKLYSSVAVLSQTESETANDMHVNLEMSPFGIIPTHITISKTETELLYSSVNTEPVKIQDSGVKIVDGMTCAKTDKMKSFVYAFRDGDNIVLYGLGGVDAPNVIILKDKIDNSFIARVTTFCRFIFEKL